MPKGYLVIFTALVILIGHIGLAGYIFVGDNRLTFSERIDTALIVAPLTAAYFLSVTIFVIQNQARSIVVKSEQANLLYYIFSIAIVGCFFVAILWILRAYKAQDITDVAIFKRMLGAVETVLGAAFALIMESLFGAIHKTAPPVGDGTL